MHIILLNLIAAKDAEDLKMPHINASDAIGNGIALAYWGVGILSVAVIIYASFRIVTARGDVEKATKGRRMIIWGMVGLMIAVLAGVITNIVVDTL